MDLSKAVDQIPPELWMTILRFATEIEKCDEFARDPITLIPNFSSNQSNQLGFIDPHLLREALMTRLRVVLVCKSWRDMCLPILWSHLVIKTEEWLNKLPPIWDVLDSRPELGSFVIRLDIDYPNFSYPEESETAERINQFLHIRLFPHLHKLRVLYVPLLHATGDFNINPEVVVLHSRYSDYYYEDWDARSHFWKNARILQVELDPSRIRRAPELILFPHLIRLRIMTQGDDTNINDIVSLWQAPKLETLSLLCRNRPLLTSFITLSRDTLTCLHLYTCRSLVGSPVELPKLRNIFLDRCFVTNWHTFIVAPSLETIHFRDGQTALLCDANRGTFINLLTDISSSYPLCKTISQYWHVVNSEPSKSVATVGYGGKLYFEPPLDPLDDYDL
jgi:hypothetical protein